MIELISSHAQAPDTCQGAFCNGGTVEAVTVAAL